MTRMIVLALWLFCGLLRAQTALAIRNHPGRHGPPEGKSRVVCQSDIFKSLSAAREVEFEKKLMKLKASGNPLDQ